MDLAGLTLVIGGAASGKSRIAEEMIKASGRPKIYVATAQIFDDEMAEKVRAHRRQRGADWTTHEAPLDLPAALATVQGDQAILIDCLTLWLTNHILAESDIDAETKKLFAAIDACPAPIVLVTNETGGGIVPENALARRFRNAQGRLNQAVAAKAERVVAVMAGIPLTLKDISA